MAIGKVRIENAQVNLTGIAELGVNEVVCVCAHCNHRDAELATVEFNFREQKVLYLCSQCKTMNEMKFGREPFAPPLPRTRIGR